MKTNMDSGFLHRISIFPIKIGNFYHFRFDG